MTQRTLLEAAAARAVQYLEALPARRVAPDPSAYQRLAGLSRPLPQSPVDPGLILQELDQLGSQGTVASAGGRYFGFVIGGSLPVALAANWLAGAWDQDAGMAVMSPAVAKMEEVALGWLLELLRLPLESSAGFVTGATMANFTGLAAARHALLERAGWDVEARGLFGAPPLTVVVGDEVHVSVLKALSLLGLGRERVVRVPTDAQGRIQAHRLPALDDRTILCIQAGNVNTGSFDPAGELCRSAQRHGAWVHVDGAFGMWAAAAPARRHLVAGFDGADSWAVDAHKWLNVPYDSGIAFCRHGAALKAAMAAGPAAYLTPGSSREPSDYVPELSRRARGVEIWTVLASLGREGVADLVERTCQYASRFAEGLRAAGHEVLNDVELNQVLVAFGDDQRTRRIIQELQEEGTCWCGGTTWHGRAAMRISVSSWATTPEDVEQSLEAMLRVATGTK